MFRVRGTGRKSRPALNEIDPKKRAQLTKELEKALNDRDKVCDEKR
jgi:hypothetical protein